MLTTVAADAPAPLKKLWWYSALTMLATVALFAGFSLLIYREHPLLLSVGLICLLPSLGVALYWDRTPPWPLSTIAITGALAWWILALLNYIPGATAACLPAAMTLALVMANNGRPRSWQWIIPPAILVPIPLILSLFVPDTANMIGASFAALVVAPILVGLVQVSIYWWNLTAQLDEARRAERELATLQERYRMSTELHDIQGHTLHIISLNIQLARKLIPADPEQASEQLVVAEQMVKDTIAETRSVIWDERETTLAAEVANAKMLFEAAGIQWTQRGTVTAEDNPLLALLVREATTNVLRHSDARRIHLDVGNRSIRMDNDGADTEQRPPRGLANLRDRFQRQGGTLDFAHENGHFTVTGKLP